MRPGHMTYNRGSGALKGNVGGKLLHVSTHSARGGAALPPGEYVIQHPMRDPVHGMIALIVPASGIQTSALGLKMDKWFPVGDKQDKYFPVGDKQDKWFPAGDKQNPAAWKSPVAWKETGALKIAPALLKVAPQYMKDAPQYMKDAPQQFKGSPQQLKIMPSQMNWLPPAADKDTPPVAQVFVLSQRAIPGRNTIVVSSHFAELMDALSAAGGVHIAVG